MLYGRTQLFRSVRCGIDERSRAFCNGYLYIAIGRRNYPDTKTPVDTVYRLCSRGILKSCLGMHERGYLMLFTRLPNSFSSKMAYRCSMIGLYRARISLTSTIRYWTVYTDHRLRRTKCMSYKETSFHV